MSARSVNHEEVFETYCLLTGLFTLSASLIWGINTLFLLESGLSLFEVFSVNAVFSACMALFEIPTGVVADALGRRKSVLLCAGIMIIGSFAFAAAGRAHAGAGVFALLSAWIALGFAFYSGAVDAWAVDALKATRNPFPLDTVFARAAIYSGAAMLVGTVLGGFLATWNLGLPYVVRGFFLTSVLIFAYRRMPELGFTPKEFGWRDYPAQMKKIAQASVFFGWKEGQVRLLILAGAAQALFIAWGYHAWQPYFLGMLEERPAWIAGLVAAAIAVAMMLGNALIARLEVYCAKRTTFLLCASAVFSVAVVGVGAAHSFIGAVGFYLISMCALGMISPIRQAYIHAVTPSEFRATVSSFDSLVSGGASSIGQGALGALGRNRSLDFSYLAGGLSTMCAIPILVLLRAGRGKGDEVVGPACATSPHPADRPPDVR